MMFFGVIFARKKSEPLSVVFVNHEEIHDAQAEDFMKEGEKKKWRAYVRYYWAYLGQWRKYGYRDCPFEREAYDNDQNLEYLETRKPKAWEAYK